MSCVTTQAVLLALSAYLKNTVMVQMADGSRANITCMGFFLFYTSVVLQAYIIVHVEMEQRAAFPSGLGDDQIIKGHIVRQNQVFLDIHQIADRRGPTCSQSGLKRSAHTIKKDHPDMMM